MIRFERRTAIAVLLAAIGCASSPSPPSPRVVLAPGQPRFANPEEIALVPAEDRPRIMPLQGAPHIPLSAAQSGLAVELLYALVIDTAGAVEPQTLSLVDMVMSDTSKDGRAQAADIESSLCEWAVNLHYTPPRPPQRTLLFFPFRFGMVRGQTLSRRVDPDAVIARLKSMPRSEAIAWLDAQPHC